MSLDEPEPIDSVLTFLSVYDILEYSWVKATAVSVHLRILFVTLQNTNSTHKRRTPLGTHSYNYKIEEISATDPS